MFDRLIHADLGTNPKKRWMAVANRAAEGWKVEAPRQVPPACEFLNDWLLDGIAVLAGFDFPIGVPVEFGRQTSFKGFLDALTKFGEGEWKEFFRVAERDQRKFHCTGHSTQLSPSKAPSELTCAVPFALPPTINFAGCVSAKPKPAGPHVHFFGRWVAIK
jgi:hypothetical protein